MRFKVTHYERYVEDPEVRIYESLKELTERYSVYADVIVEMVKDLKIGESVSFPYDLKYIELTVERMTGVMRGQKSRYHK